MGKCSKIFYVFAISVLLSLCSQITLSLEAKNGLKKLLIQSSNNEIFSFTSLSTQDREQDINETWRATGFQVRNVTLLTAEYPLLVSPSLPLKNSSRFFSSKNASASMTVLIKNFKHEVLFLNFSYFIGKLEKTSESQVAKTNDSIVNQKLSDETNSESTTKTEATSSSNINTSQSQLGANTVIVITPNVPVPTNMQPIAPELNQSSVSISIKSPSKDAKSSESIPIKTETQRRRKRRSVIRENMALNATFPTPAKLEGDLNVIKQAKISMATEKDVKLNSDGNVPTISAPSIIVPNSNNVTVTNPIDSLTLVQAVEMIKSAAAAISKGSLISINPVQSSPVKVTGVVDDLSDSLTSTSTAATSDDSIPTTTEKNERTTSSTTVPRLQEMVHDISSSGDIKTATEITLRNHHKSKNASNKNVRKEKQKRKSKGKKVDNTAERNEENEEDEADNLSSSSSSSSEEIDDEHEEEKPKISYKMWRASLEKKNRPPIPPGLYVTVNDDVIFDNWEGIWDKNYVLGKWTGSKTLENGKWNHTNLFLNWNSAPTGRDVKITFEWEPIIGDYELILSNIEISTLISLGDSSCTAPLPAWSNDEGYKETDKVRFGQEQVKQTENYDQPGVGKVGSFSSQISNESEASVIVLKQTKNGKEGWEVVRVGKAEPSTMGKIKELDLHQLPVSNDKVKLEQKEINAEDILQAIIQGLRNNIRMDTAIQNTSTTLPVVTSDISASTSSLKQVIVSSNDQSKALGNKNNISIETMIVSSSSLNETKDVSSANLTTTSPTPEIPQETSTNSFAPSSALPSPTASHVTPSSNTSTNTPVITEITTTSSTTNATLQITPGSSIPVPVGTAAMPNSSREATSKRPPRKTDRETALVVSLLTGSIALIILILSVKKRIDISLKGRNAAR